MEIYLNDKLLDRVVWKKKGTKHRYYYIPGIKGQVYEIRTKANDSYNPYKAGLSKRFEESRDQSAAITDITFYRIPIPEGTAKWAM